MEKTNLGIADIAAIVVVMLISAAIGIYFRFSGGRQKTTKEFLVAGRSMSPFPVVLSLIVTFVSGIMMTGVPSEVYQFGLYRMVAYFCTNISTVFSAYIFLPVYFQMGESVSVYEYLERRFGVLVRKVSSALFIIQSVFYMAIVLLAPALALSAVADNLDLYLCIVSIGGVCTLYCCMGGMKAVLWTDVFQAIVMYISIFAIFTKGILSAKISILEALHAVHHEKDSFFSSDPGVRYTIWNCVLYGFLYGLFNYGCNQAQVQRMLSVKSLKLSQRAVIASVPLAIIFIAMNFSLGIVMYSIYYDSDPVPCKIEKRDQLVPHFIMEKLTKYPGLAGLCVAGIFSGSLSTISSSVNSLAAVTMEDFVGPYFATRRKMADSTAAVLVKVFACVYGIAGMVAAVAMRNVGLIDGYTVIYGTVSGPVLGLFTLGMMTVTAEEKGALLGLLSGIFTTSCLGIVSYVRKQVCKAVCPPKQPATNVTISTFFSNFTAIDNSTDHINSSTADLSTMTDHFVFTKDFYSYPPDIFSTTADIFSSTQESAEVCKNKEWLSVMWLLIIGFTVTLVVGYISSLLRYSSKGKEKEKVAEVHPSLLSPVVRKWLLKPLPEHSQDEAEEFIKLNGASEA